MLRWLLAYTVFVYVFVLMCLFCLFVLCVVCFCCVPFCCCVLCLVVVLRCFNGVACVSSCSLFVAVCYMLWLLLASSVFVSMSSYFMCSCSCYVCVVFVVLVLLLFILSCGRLF